MSKKVHFILSNSGRISLVVGNRTFSVEPEHLNYDEIKTSLLKGNADPRVLVELVDVAETVQKYVAGSLTVSNGVIYQNGVPLHHVLVDRVINLMRGGYDYQPMLRFLENLLENPSKRAQDELYGFLQHQGMPITEDGCFLGYKRVRDDWMDVHSGTQLNKIGTTVSMARNKVDDNWGVACSQGYHVGALEYVRNYSSGGHVLIVKVNPRDVVSVPTNEVTKLRTCQYEIVDELKEDKHLVGDVYVATPETGARPVVPTRKVSTADNHKSQKRDRNGRFVKSR